MAITDSLDAATQQILALLTQLKLSNARVVTAQDIGQPDHYVFMPTPAVANYGADLFLLVDVANPNQTTTPTLTVSGQPLVALTASDGGPLIPGTVYGKTLIGFSSLVGGGFQARVLSQSAVPAYGEDTSTTAGLVTVSIPAYGGAWVKGRPFRAKINQTSVGPTQISVNNLPVIDVRRQDLFAGRAFPTRRFDLRQGQVAEFVYDGAVAQLASDTFGLQSVYFGQDYATGGVMTPADLGSLVQLGVSANNTNYQVTLPKCGDCVNGGQVAFYCNAASTAILTAQGTDKIALPDGSTVTALNFSAGDTLALISTGVTGLWLAWTGSIMTRYASDFRNLLAANGYQKIGAFLMQWGSCTTTSSSAGTPVSFPIFFPNNCFGTLANDSGASDYTWGTQGNGNGSFVAYAKSTSGSLVSGANARFWAWGN